MAEYAVQQDNAVDTAQRMRIAQSGLIPATGPLTSRTGLFRPGGGVTLTTGMSVSVNPFRGFIQGASSATQGGYWIVLDTAKTLTFADGGATSRTDIIVARVRDNPFDGSGAVSMSVEIVQGTPGAGTPATPANSVLLATKVITAGMSAGTGGLGTAPVDARPPALATAGGIVPVVDTADRATLGLFDGLTVYRIDAGQVEVRRNGQWVTLATSTGWVAASGLSMASGWSLNTAFIKRIDQDFAVLELRVTRTGADIVPGSDGNIVPDVTIATGLNPAPTWRTTGFCDGGSGAVIAVQPTGSIELVSAVSTKPITGFMTMTIPYRCG